MSVSRLLKKIVVKFELELVTGMRIGASDPGIAIGAIDSPVIRDPKSGEPFIPGSSLKGKLRCSLERVLGEYSENGRAGNDSSTLTGKLFGVSADSKGGGLTATRLTVRDAFLTDRSRKLFESDTVGKYLDAPYTEVKTEIGVDRLTGGPQRGNLRQVERVPRGAVFGCEVVLSIWDNDGDGNDLREALANCLTLLETEYLGGSGTRGYGQVKVNPKEILEISFNGEGAIKEEKLDGWGSALPFKSLLHGGLPMEVGDGASQ